MDREADFELLIFEPAMLRLGDVDLSHKNAAGLGC